ncbi:MAG: nucleoside triphosphate pyrophosphohydrolase [Pseudomonadota bacterium]
MSDHIKTPLSQRLNGAQTGDIASLLAIMAKLRDPDSGCPWDVKQSFESIVPYTIEEAYEVADAIARGDMEDLCDELGDLLLQIVFYAQMAEEADHFTFADVVGSICRKMIRRHPHVFGDVDRCDEQAVKRNWETIKAQEKAERRVRRGERDDDKPSVLDGVPATLPPLQRAFKLQEKAARVGFDWPNAESVIDKIHEEIHEVEDELRADYPQRDRIEDEIGDLLFVVTNLARKLEIDPAIALERTNRKFVSRFSWLEKDLAESNNPVGTASLQVMEEAWQRAKEEA